MTKATKIAIAAYGIYYVAGTAVICCTEPGQKYLTKLIKANTEFITDIYNRGYDTGYKLGTKIYDWFTRGRSRDELMRKYEEAVTQQNKLLLNKAKELTNTTTDM